MLIYISMSVTGRSGHLLLMFKTKTLPQQTGYNNFLDPIGKEPVICQVHLQPPAERYYSGVFSSCDD